MHLSGQRTVSFIANLIPLCTFDAVDGLSCARSLHDGTLVLPMQHDEPQDELADEWVTVWWQGDRNRASNVLAGLLASKLVIEYVQLQSVGKPAGYSKGLLEHLAQHFEFKTGQSLFVSDDEDSPLFQVIEGAKKYWPSVVWEIIKRTI